jgi:hypothetical protein
MDFQDTDERQPEQQQDIAIYSKWAILGFSILVSPLVGAILLMINLRSVGFKRQSISVLLFTIAYLFLASMVIGSVLKPPANVTLIELAQNKTFIIYNLVAQIIGGGILAEYFYKKYFPADHYKYKSIWRPLAVMLIITLAINLFR